MQRLTALILVVTVISVAIWLYLYFFVSPYAAGTEDVILIRLIIYLAGFGIGITGIGTLLGYYLRKLISPYSKLDTMMFVSFRQAALFAGGIVFIFALSITYTLTIATAILTIVSLIVLEWFLH